MDQPPVESIRANPTLHPDAFRLVVERFPLKWHTHADSSASSQAYALSAFVPVLEFADKDAIIERLVSTALPHIPHRGDREWTLIPEYEDRELLGETSGGVPTNVDILLVSDDVVVCVESKYLVDARHGFGGCSQFSSKVCLGYYGSGSDTKGTDAWCRLSIPEGRRGGRLYWSLGEPHFRREVLAEQGPEQACPYRDVYQLMRNYLFASELARRGGKPYYGVIGIVPRIRNAAMRIGVDRFQARVLRPEFSSRVIAYDYEDYITILDIGSEPASRLASFLRERLPDMP